MYIEIKSKDNEKFKYVKSLLKKKHRNLEKKFIVEGHRIIKQALEVEAEVETVMFIEDYLRNDGHEQLLMHLSEGGVNIFKVTKALFDELTDTQHSQGIVAVVRAKEYTLEAELPKARFALVLDRIQDPGNMGTIIRTADAAGVDVVVLLKGCTDPYSSKVLRSTMGSVFNMKLLFADESKVAVELIKQSGFTLVSSMLDTSTYYDEIEFPQKTALVIGNEGSGIEDWILEESGVHVKIPIYGSAESLNAAIAAGILMYRIAGFIYCK
ncbi:putative tRNA/rRNA methyltransferase YsgA [Peptoclostridium acidaminophilum DSM 3953]|uniref:Putative tRNA/rRNA methyltransferase YsgA n=1 Tax=Peptoclostridium acidaminophilum DSM 3953 TaxID=1286171 RepID=W8T363_PEPAC|nr:RNA methyltransferase [Peptoclostridium acidaminophilum]AHM56189.1 putative tRNA/rRNA methyltransferase YsgA [Peptoclostridium acidaminophilum DSM 3953]